MVLLKIDGSEAQPSELSLAEHAHGLLVGKIVSLDLPPGNHLFERELMASLNLGRTPIREALHRLSNEGLVCRLPHQGVYVCEVTFDSVRQLYELRLMTDGTIAELATERASDEQVSYIIAAAKRIESSYRDGDLDNFTSEGRRFARTLAAASANIHVTELVPRVYNLDARLTYLADAQLKSWQILGHGIVETALSLAGVIKRRLPKEAKLLAELHIERRYQYLFEVLSMAEPSQAVRRA